MTLTLSHCCFIVPFFSCCFYLKRPSLISLFHFTKRCVSISVFLSLSLSFSLFLSLSLSLFLSLSLSPSLSLSLFLFLCFFLSQSTPLIALITNLRTFSSLFLSLFQILKEQYSMLFLFCIVCLLIFYLYRSFVFFYFSIYCIWYRVRFEIKERQFNKPVGQNLYILKLFKKLMVINFSKVSAKE